MYRNINKNGGERSQFLPQINQWASLRFFRDINGNNKININDINDNLFNKYLCTVDIPEPELLIRTSGEYRISNFLLWQIAYCELYFSDKLWPDYCKEDLFKAIYDYQNRERRFGKISEQIN